MRLARGVLAQVVLGVGVAFAASLVAVAAHARAVPAIDRPPAPNIWAAEASCGDGSEALGAAARCLPARDPFPSLDGRLGVACGLVAAPRWW